MNYRILPIALLLFVSSVALCQEEKNTKPGKEPNELDKIYTPDKNSGNPSNGTSSASSFGEKKNFVKFNFALLTRSTCAFFYERKLTDGISVQGGVGFNFGRDFMQVVGMSEMDMGFTRGKSELSIGRILNEGTFVKGRSPFLAASFRFFYSGWWYDSGDRNSYIELGMRYVSHHYDLLKLENYPQEVISGGAGLAVKNYCYSVTWGVQIETDSKLVTSHEFYTGFGIRRTNYNIFTKTETLNPVPNYYGYNDYVPLYTRTADKEVAISAMLTIGYVLGFGF